MFEIENTRSKLVEVRGISVICDPKDPGTPYGETTVNKTKAMYMAVWAERLIRVMEVEGILASDGRGNTSAVIHCPGGHAVWAQVDPLMRVMRLRGSMYFDPLKPEPEIHMGQLVLPWSKVDEYCAMAAFRWLLE